MINRRLRILLAVSTLAAVNLYAAVTNWKSGIDATYSGTDGTDYKEEYLFYNRKVGVQKQVWLKGATNITLAHNARNVATTTGRPKSVVGTGANKGQIRYGFDKMWSDLTWSAQSGTPYPLYTAPFSLSTQEYETGVPVVGTTGGNGFAQTAKFSFYYRGIIDSVGDEWHVFKYADDDYVDYPSASGDAVASDGNWFMIVVNPITPCLTVDATDSTGQYFTTPAYVYNMPVIRDQTTYFQGNNTITLTNIYGGNISYDINGGSTVNVGAATKVFTQADFSTGSTTLRYWYTSTPSVKRTRIIVKNPPFPSAGETHGNTFWGSSGNLTTIAGRVIRAPYDATYAKFSNRSSYFTKQNDWNSDGGQGYRLGGPVAAWGSGAAANNAFQALLLGFTAVASGSSKTYADYATEMMIESGYTTPNLGWELRETDVSQASAELNYRGYWDVALIYDVCVAYDILIANYRSDQGFANGITPIQDYFVRDQMACWVHFCNMWRGDWYQGGAAGGMWGSARNTGAMVCTLTIPSYSTNYYGTSGMDGNTTTNTWTPYQTTNYTWKSMYVTQTASISGSYPDAPVAGVGWEDAGTDSMITSAGLWNDKIDYTSNDQMGYNTIIYRMMQVMYAPSVTHTALDTWLANATNGVGYVTQAGSFGLGPFRQSYVGVLNTYFPTFAANGNAVALALPSSDINSSVYQIDVLGLWAFMWYDDTYFGNSSGSFLSGGISIKGGVTIK